MGAAFSPKINITIRLDKALVRKIRVLAAERGTSWSALIAAKFEEDLAQRGRHEEAKKKAVAFMEEGWVLSGLPLPREDLHKR